MKLGRPANSAENELLVSSLFVVLLLSARTFVESWQQKSSPLDESKKKTDPDEKEGRNKRSLLGPIRILLARNFV